MNEDIEKLLNQLEKSIKEPVLLGEDYYTGEGWEEPNFFCLDPTTNDCKTLFDYITKLQNNWNELKKWLEVTIEQYDNVGLKFKKESNFECASRSYDYLKQYQTMLDKMQEMEQVK